MAARLTMLLVAVSAIAVFALGCGDSDDDASGAGTETTVEASSLSKAAYIKKADAICLRGAEETLAYEPPPEAKSESERFTATLENSLLPRFQDIADEVRDLGAPSGDEAQVEAYLAALEQGLADIEKRSDSLSGLDQVEKSLDPAGKVARSYGFKNCAF